jgi:hypothetical protein
LGVEANDGELLFLDGAAESDAHELERIGSKHSCPGKLALDDYAVVLFDHSDIRSRRDGPGIRQFALLIKDSGEHWERVVLLESK